MKGKLIMCKLKSKKVWCIVIACWFEWYVMVSTCSKGDGSEESRAGRSLYDNINKNKDIEFLFGSAW